MAMNKSAVTFVILLTGAVVAGLGGRRLCEPAHVEAAIDSGPVSVHRMGGDIDVADAPNGADLHTMGGNIHVGKVGSFAKVKTMGGNIDIDHADASVNASTMGGKITLRSVNGSIHASTMAGDLTIHEVGASSSQRDIELSSKAGTVELTVPKDFPMEVRIKLAYTKNAGDHYRIIDHAGLAQRESQDWDTSEGSPRKYIRAEGRVGNGMNHVTIDTINGDVILRQE
jgi:DUF4097 and DUF4098 domain-containing protein YvlB